MRHLGSRLGFKVSPRIVKPVWTIERSLWGGEEKKKT